MKSHSDIFSDFLCVIINSSIKSFSFPSCLKKVDITPSYKKGKRDLKDNYRPVSIYRFSQNYMKEACSCKYPSFLRMFSQKTNVDSGKVTALNNAS